MRKAQLLPLLALTAACAPQSAELTSGQYVAFVAESNSQTLRQERIDPEAFDTYVQVDCRLFETEEEAEALRLDDRLPLCGPGDDGSEDIFSIDTDGAYDTEFGDQFPDVYDIDDDNDGVFDIYDCDDKDPNKFDAAEDCDGTTDGAWPPSAEQWLKYDGYHVVSEELEPWRGEAIVTHEGDLQIGFHHRMPGKTDFSFQFTVDRFFQPVRCAVDYENDGAVVRSAYDGDWVAEWSKDLQAIADLDDEDFAPYAHLEDYLDGQLFYLNARGYQVNPENTDDWWYVPFRWAAGSAFGKFGEEFLNDRQDYSADAYFYDLFEAQGVGEGAFGSDLSTVFGAYLWACDRKAGDTLDAACENYATLGFPGVTVADLKARADAEAQAGVLELDQIFREADPEKEPFYAYASMIHDNQWRIIDGTVEGYDGWVQRFPNYVVFSKDSDLRIGGSARGAFTLLLQGQDSNTKVLVRGEFDIETIKKDRWAPPDLQQDKRDESGLEYCGF